MGKRSPTTTDVEIFGSVYAVRGEQESDYLQELAREVDERMKAIAAQVSNTDPTRVAILASLNLADELFQCRRRWEGDREEISEKAVRLSGALKEVLAS